MIIHRKQQKYSIKASILCSQRRHCPRWVCSGARSDPRGPGRPWRPAPARGPWRRRSPPGWRWPASSPRSASPHTSTPQLVIFVLTRSDRVMTLASGMWKVVTILALQLTTDTGLGKKGKYADNLGGGFCVLWFGLRCIICRESAQILP